MQAGNRYAVETAMGRTLGQLLDAKTALVAICRRCKHRSVLYPANLIPRFGAGEGTSALLGLPVSFRQSSRVRPLTLDPAHMSVVRRCRRKPTPAAPASSKRG